MPRPMDASGDLVIRDLPAPLRRTFIDQVLETAGSFDRESGLLEATEREFGDLLRPGLWTLLALLRITGRAPVRFLVAVHGKRLVGTTVAVFLPRLIYLAAVSVQPDFRRQGIATRLLNRGLEIGARRAVAAGVLDVDADNTPAVTLYQREGWNLRRETTWIIAESANVPPPAKESPPFREARDEDLEALADVVHKEVGLPLPRVVLEPAEVVFQGPTWRSKHLISGAEGKPNLFARLFWKDGLPTAYVSLWSAPGVRPDVLKAALETQAETARALGLRRIVADIANPAMVPSLVGGTGGFRELARTQTREKPLGQGPG